MQPPFVLEGETWRMVGVRGFMTRMKDVIPVAVIVSNVNYKTYHAQPMGRRERIACLPLQAKGKEATVQSRQDLSSQLQPQIYLVK